MHFVILGASGQLGRCLTHLLVNQGASTSAVDRHRIDLTDQAAVERELRRIGTDVLVNAAAYTNVDAAENEIAEARLANAQLPGLLARACARVGVRLVHISTDYVFDGAASHPYQEDSPLSPLGVYGLTKAEGEEAVLSEDDSALIIRTSWLFSEFRSNFLKTMLRLGSERDELRIVSDQYGCPTDAHHLARAILKAAEQELTGIAHYSDHAPTTWAGFASFIFASAHRLGLIPRVPNVAGIPTSEYPTPAKRPAYSVLANQRIAYQADWRDGVARVLSEISAADPRGERRR